MYVPPHFQESDPAEVAAVIDTHPLACIVAQTDEGLVANHIPLLRQGDGPMIGHVARANRMHMLIADGAEVLAIFRGEEAAISPNLYPSKAETHRAVPTWNYQVVHVQGRIHWNDGEKFKRKAVGLLTKRMEGAGGWRMADAPPDFMATMLDAIIGFELVVIGVVAKTKVNQNRIDADFNSVQRQMESDGKVELAGRMARMGRATE